MIPFSNLFSLLLSVLDIPCKTNQKLAKSQYQILLTYCLGKLDLPATITLSIDLSFGRQAQNLIFTPNYSPSKHLEQPLTSGNVLSHGAFFISWPPQDNTHQAVYSLPSVCISRRQQTRAVKSLCSAVMRPGIKPVSPKYHFHDLGKLQIFISVK